MSTIGFTFGDAVATSAHGGHDQGAGLAIPRKGAVAQFDAAMDRAGHPNKIAQADRPAPVGQPADVPAARAPGAPEATVGNPGVDARERARKALGLEAPAAPTSAPDGDAIIEGMQKLRGVFDAQTARINAISSSKDLDVGTLMSMQMELVRFSLLVEVTSKLTGKSTQAFDTLMKGQ